VLLELGVTDRATMGRDGLVERQHGRSLPAHHRAYPASDRRPGRRPPVGKLRVGIVPSKRQSRHNPAYLGVQARTDDRLHRVTKTARWSLYESRLESLLSLHRHHQISRLVIIHPLQFTAICHRI
jgi:hypothetical protein